MATTKITAKEYMKAGIATKNLIQPTCTPKKHFVVTVTPKNYIVPTITVKES